MPELMPYFYPEKHTNIASSEKDIKHVHEVRVGAMLQLLDQHLSNHPYLAGEKDAFYRPKWSALL
ncbi:glutathione S-transferase family protein [Salinibius halmophilus]|uniref:hypothetical protein n=1 Tax=Salinibius halmophilus TaxID=1853216 RepID=UPI0013142452|nr:hypothetical protein [Salinibius halmophilus]